MLISVLQRAKARGVMPQTLIMLEQFEEALARDPNDANAFATMGRWWHWERDYANALDCFHAAVRLSPRFAFALCARADLRATCPDAAYRDGRSAVQDATLALELASAEGILKEDWKHRMYLRVVAAAFAEAGDFAAALRAESDALAFSFTKLAIAPIKARMEKYRAGQPVRDDRGLVR